MLNKSGSSSAGTNLDILIDVHAISLVLELLKQRANGSKTAGRVGAVEAQEDIGDVASGVDLIPDKKEGGASQTGLSSGGT